MAKNCSTCKFWYHIQGRKDGVGVAATGECRRHPPQTQMGQDRDDRSPQPLWPITRIEHWCGEYEEGRG